MQGHKAKLSTIFLIVFVDLVGFGMVIPFIPLWAEKHQPSALTLALLMASYSTMQFLAAPVLGRLSDRFGRRPVLIASLIGSVSGYVLLALAHSLPLLFASRIVDGISGGNISTAHAVISDITTPANRAKGMGLIGAAFGLGFICGPALGGVLMTVAPWLPAAAAALTSLIALGMVWFLLPETRPDGAQRAPSRYGMLALAGMPAIMARPTLRNPLVLALFMTVAFASFEMTFALLLNQQFSLDERSIGLMLAGVGVLAAIVQGGLIGRLSRRFGDAKLVLTGSILAVIGLAALPSAHSLSVLIPPLILLGFGVGIAGPSLSALTSKRARTHEMGEVMGVYQSLSSLGRVIGPFLGGYLYKAVGKGWPYWAGALLMLVAAALAGALVRQEPSETVTIPAA